MMFDNLRWRESNHAWYSAECNFESKFFTEEFRHGGGFINIINFAPYIKSTAHFSQFHNFK